MTPQVRTLTRIKIAVNTSVNKKANALACDSKLECAAGLEPARHRKHQRKVWGRIQSVSSPAERAQKSPGTDGAKIIYNKGIK